MFLLGKFLRTFDALQNRKRLRNTENRGNLGKYRRTMPRLVDSGMLPLYNVLKRYSGRVRKHEFGGAAMPKRYVQRAIFLFLSALTLVFLSVYSITPHSLHLPVLPADEAHFILRICDAEALDICSASYPAPSVEISLSPAQKQEILNLLPSLRARRSEPFTWQYAAPVHLTAGKMSGEDRFLLWSEFAQVDGEYIPYVYHVLEDTWYQLDHCEDFLEAVLQYYPDRDHFFPPLYVIDKIPSEWTYEDVQNSPAYQSTKEKIKSALS